MKWAARPLQATLFFPCSPLVWGKRWKRALGGGGLLESWGVPRLSVALSHGPLIKDIISQQNQPRSQHDWECLINTKEKHCVRAKSLKTATSIIASKRAQECCFSQSDECFHCGYFSMLRVTKSFPMQTTNIAVKAYFAETQSWAHLNATKKKKELHCRTTNCATHPHFSGLSRKVQQEPLDKNHRLFVMQNQSSGIESCSKLK